VIGAFNRRAPDAGVDRARIMERFRRFRAPRTQFSPFAHAVSVVPIRFLVRPLYQLTG